MRTLARKEFTASDNTDEEALRSKEAWWGTQALWENHESEYGVLLKSSLLAIKDIESRLT